MNEHTCQILESLRGEISEQQRKTIKPLNCDKYLASSALQKSIRRGDEAAAQRAAITYWKSDKVSFWRRLSVISVEDCVAAPDSVAKTLAAADNSAFRSSVGDLATGLYLVRLLSRTVKLRLSDELYSFAVNTPELKEQRRAYATTAKPFLADLVLSGTQALPERLLALWYLAGTDRFPHKNLHRKSGCVDWVSEVIRELKAPAGLTAACIENLTRTRYPLSLFMPLLTVYLSDLPRPVIVAFDKFQPSPSLNGIPLVAVDGFTRSGKAAFVELSQAVKELKSFSQKQIALGVFFTQGFCVNQRLTSATLDQFRQDGEIADMESVGLDLPRHMALREVLTEHSATLEDIRRKHLLKAFGNQQDDLFEDA